MIIQIDVDQVNSEMVNDLVKNITKHKGEHSLLVRLQDLSNGYSVNLLSRKNKVSLDKEMVNQIKKINGVEVLIKS